MDERMPPAAAAVRLKPAAGALAAASAICAGMVAARIVYVKEWTYYWLIVPNLLLAWIPLTASILAVRTLGDGRRPGMATLVWGAVWLAFFPNAPYLSTDIIHLRYAGTNGSLYYDLSVNMLAAMVGLALGFISLHLLHAEVNRRAGRWIGAFFAGSAIGLGSVGVYLGRVLRWNSWDLAVKPWQIVIDAAEIFRHADSLLFVAAFSLYTGTMYVVYYLLFGGSMGNGSPRKKTEQNDLQ
jgi:uncharacterized membrane protein